MSYHFLYFFASFQKLDNYLVDFTKAIKYLFQMRVYRNHKGEVGTKHPQDYNHRGVQFTGTIKYNLTVKYGFISTFVSTILPTFEEFFRLK